MSDNPIHERLQTEINQNDVVLFMKGSPVFPQCGFSAAVVQLLGDLNIKFKGIDVLEDPSVRQGIKTLVTGPPFRSFTLRANLSVVVTSFEKCLILGNYKPS